MSNSVAELEGADVLFVTGGNPHVAHPVIGTFLTGAKKKGTKIINVDPRVIQTSRLSDIHLQIDCGTDIPLINGMIHHIIKNDLHDKKFIEERTKKFDELWEAIKEYTPERASELTGVPVEDICNAAEMYAKGPKSAIVWGMGIAQRANAVETVWSLANLAMVCGMIGKESTGLNPLRGQNNVQGACDMACLPHFLPGYKVFDEDFARVVAGIAGTDADAAVKNAKADRERFEKAWGVSLNPKHGLTELEMTDKAGTGEVKCMYIVGADPVIANPDSNKVIADLKNLDFFVVQELFMTETAKMADVVLPGCSIAEQYGTVVNTERRIQMVRPAIKPIGNSRPDYEIIIDLMSRFGYENNMSSAEDVMKEISKMLPQYAGVSYEKIQRNDSRYKGVRWPIAADAEEGTKFLHGAGFPVGQAEFKPAQYSPIKEPPCSDYPLVLVTIRDMYHYDNLEMTGKTKGLMELDPYGMLDINPEDAKKYNLTDGDKVTIRSRRGEATAVTRITDTVKPGNVFSNFHHPGTHINMVTTSAMDPIAAEPELKACAVQISKA